MTTVNTTTHGLSLDESELDVIREDAESLESMHKNKRRNSSSITSPMVLKRRELKQRADDKAFEREIAEIKSVEWGWK